MGYAMLGQAGLRGSRKAAASESGSKPIRSGPPRALFLVPASRFLLWLPLMMDWDLLAT